MKTYSRIAVLFVVVVMVLLIFLFFQRTTAPESSIIAGQRNELAASQDKQRMGTDPVYAYEIRRKLRFLDHRLAVAYNKENKPEAAISVLDELINDEEAKNRDDAMRSSRSYIEEALYYETLQESYILKHDEAAAAKAGRYHDELMVKAETAEKRERLEDGKSVTTPKE